MKGQFVEERTVKTPSIMLVSVLAFAGQAIADTSDGTKNWTANADHANHGIAAAGKIPACKSIYDDGTFCSLNRDQTIANTPGIVSSADELKAQAAANTAHRRRVYDALVQDGGCNADVLPTEYHAPCNQVFVKATEGN